MENLANANIPRLRFRSGEKQELSRPETNQRLVDLGYVIIGDQPEEFRAHMKSEISKLANVIRQSGATVN